MSRKAVVARPRDIIRDAKLQALGDTACSSETDNAVLIIDGSNGPAIVGVPDTKSNKIGLVLVACKMLGIVVESVGG